MGLLWASWHLPVINYLGSATPHGAYWYALFLAFTVAMIAMRVLICWIYVNTNEPRTNAILVRWGIIAALRIDMERRQPL